MNDRRSILSLSLLLGAVIALVFLAGFGSGFVVRGQEASNTSSSSDPNLSDFLSAYHLVTQRSYYRPFNQKQLIYAAIQGMLSATGDPHTVFLSPPENQVANTELNGSQFSGIGAIVQPACGILQILAPLPHTPSSRAGLRAGDVVTRINGRSVAKMSSDTAVTMIHGRTGSTVRLTILRGHQHPFTVTVHRAEIPPITAYPRLLGHHLGYLQIFSFGDQTSREVANSLAYLNSQHVRGIVLDLRENPGGYVDAAQQVVSQFISHGVVAYEKEPDHHLVPLPMVTGEKVAHQPLVVLVDSGTASAAEITAGALHDYHRALIMGTRTYGKGSMQSVYSLADGSTLRITDRLWLTPDKHSIQSVGIRPDVVVKTAIAPGCGQDALLTIAENHLLGQMK